MHDCEKKWLPFTAKYPISFFKSIDIFIFKWYRPDVVIAVMYFVFANSSPSAFLVHAFEFAAGILISFVMILTGAIKIRPQ